jgi:AhpD family alkylhydroperoxidase
MPSRNAENADSELVQLLAQLQEHAIKGGLEPGLVALVGLRVSQINGCGRSVALHTEAARSAGETQERLTALAVWHQSPYFTDRERAALEWSEAVTQVAQSHVSQEAWQRLAPQLAPEEIVDLTLLAAQSHVPDALWIRLTPQLAGQAIDDLTLLVTAINIRHRLQMTV